MTILNDIKKGILLCYEQRRNPIYILMNPNLESALIEEIKCRFIFPLECIASNPSTIFGLSILICNVKDFLIIDNRSWFEQKF